MDSIRESAFFTKQLEGYPSPFHPEKFGGASIGLYNDKIAITDFYESFKMVPKITASLFQAFDTLDNTLKPENGTARSAIELNMIQEARLLLNSLQENFIHNNQDCEVLGQNIIEEDFYFACPDKLNFLMKELKAEMHPQRSM